MNQNVNKVVDALCEVILSRIECAEETKFKLYGTTADIRELTDALSGLLAVQKENLSK